MTFALFWEGFVGLLKFPDAVVRLVRLLSKTDQQKHDGILAAAEEAQRKFEDTGRPSWDA